MESSIRAIEFLVNSMFFVNFINKHIIILNWLNSLWEIDKIFGKPRIFPFPSTHLINTTLQIHSSKILHLEYKRLKENVTAAFCLFWHNYKSFWRWSPHWIVTVVGGLAVYTVKPVISGHSKIEKTKILMTNGSWMKVESIAECSPWSILQYFWPALRDNWAWKLIFGLFESGRFRQVLLYNIFLSNDIIV